MNVSQILIRAREALSAGKTGNDTFPEDTFWSDSELLGLANQGQTFLFNVAQRSRPGLFTRRLRSIDAPIDLMGHKYDPSQLAIVTGTTDYNLPPDFLQMIALFATNNSSGLLDGGAQSIDQVSIGEDFDDAGTGTLANVGDPIGAGLTHSVLSNRRLLIYPTPTGSSEVVLFYVYGLTPMRMKESVAAVVVSVLADEVTASFTKPANFRISVGDEVMDATEAVDPNETYPYVVSIDENDKVVLSQQVNYNKKIRVSSVSQIPFNHHEMIATWIIKEGFKKSTNPSPEAAQGYVHTFNDMLRDFVDDVEQRNRGSLAEVTPYLPGGIGNFNNNVGFGFGN